MRYGTGLALVALSALVWSMQGMIFRQIHTASPWAVLVWRSIGMLPVVFVMAWHASGGAPMAAMRRLGGAGWLGAVGLVVAYGGAIYAIQTTTVANAMFLYSATPFLAALIGRLLLAEAVRPVTWAAIGLALVGIFVMVRDGLAGGAILGNLSALMSALGFAIYTVALRWRGGAGDQTPILVAGAGLSFCAGLAALGLAGQGMAAPLSDILWSLAMGAGTLTGGMLLYSAGSRVVPAAELALLSNAEVILGPLWVWMFLGEHVRPGTLVGGAIILCAVLANAAIGLTRTRA